MKFEKRTLLLLAFALLFSLLFDSINAALFSYYYVILSLIFFINAFYDASRGVLMPLVVDHNDLVACNALDSLTWLFCSYAGAAVGGAVNSAFGLTVTYIANGFCFVAALVLSIVLMWYPELNPPKPAGTPTKTSEIVKHSFKELLGGFKMLFSGKGYLFSFTICKLIGSLCWASIEFQNVKFSELPEFQLFSEPESTATLAYCLFGIGSGLAPMLCELLLGNRIRRSLRSAFWTRFIILVSFLMVSVGFAMLVFAFHVSIFLMANFIIGAAGGTLWVYSTSAIEHLTPNHYLGRRIH